MPPRSCDEYNNGEDLNGLEVYNRITNKNSESEHILNYISAFDIFNIDYSNANSEFNNSKFSQYFNLYIARMLEELCFPTKNNFQVKKIYTINSKV